ncbi:hypothetical protein GCM10022267_29620 [Lentzea roselyniae]|uniref:Uncharacterized protein n=1 Tax=Lentzea roselyniae TaxID=531940 RepID=A0ABP7AVA9_9PSEU
MQAGVDRPALRAPQQRDREQRDDAGDHEADADGRSFDDQSGGADQRGDEEVVEDDAAAEPDQQFDGDLGEQEPGTPRGQPYACCAQQDSHRTSNDVTHFVCSTPGRFGAMSRQG